MYIPPGLLIISIDNDVTLILESSPPSGPAEVKNNQYQNNPFGNNT